ncbi:NAD-dependent epimerase/dehydratase [Dillenia turbinata]|uniref:NAD-dependent epimerase/dehydratase n=1 Tax=Dillenia turbinata TaxID=194707 RepID=A0AAN8UR92_9MAGN
MEREKEAVCVTGGTGFVGSWLIMRLLQHGYKVRTTIRPDPEGHKDTSFLTNLPGASERLQIFNADLNDPNSFNEAIEGCVGVFHVAHTMDIRGIEPEEIVIGRCVEGTLGILKACLNSSTIKRVVLTSTLSNVMNHGTNVDVMDESIWSDIDYCRRIDPKKVTYFASKMQTEKDASEFAQKNGLDLVIVLPSLVTGPFLTPEIPLSVQLQLAMIKGNKDKYAQIVEMSMVHVDDVASAHIFLFENPDAKGRYICSSHELSIFDMSKLLSTRYPEYPVPSEEDLKDFKCHEKSAKASSKKLLDMGFKYKYSVEDMFDAAIQSCKERGLFLAKA